MIRRRYVTGEELARVQLSKQCKAGQSCATYDVGRITERNAPDARRPIGRIAFSLVSSSCLRSLLVYPPLIPTPTQALETIFLEESLQMRETPRLVSQHRASSEPRRLCRSPCGLLWVSLCVFSIPECLSFFIGKPQYTSRQSSCEWNILSTQQRRRTMPLFALYNKKKKNIRQDEPIPKVSSKTAASSNSRKKKAVSLDVTDLPGVLQVTALSDDLVSIELCIPGEITQQAYINACANASQSMHIPGFPRGAVLPHSLVELMHGKSTLQTQAVTAIVSEHLAMYVEPALRLHEFDPVFEQPPRLTLTYEQLAAAHYKPGEPLVFSVECEVIPPPPPPPEPEVMFVEPDVAGVPEPWTTTPVSAAYSDMPVEELLVRSDPTAWNRELYESMQQEFADLVPAPDADYQLHLGDACEVHLTGYPVLPDGSIGLPLPSESKGGNVLGDRVTVLLKGGKYMPGLVEGLMGMRAGERITLFVHFPNVRACFVLL